MHRLHICRGVRLPQRGPPVGRGWRPVMLKDRTQVVGQFMTCNTPLWPYLGLDWRSERPPTINRLVTSSPSTYMIAPTLLPLWQSPTLFIIWVLEGGGCESTCPGNDVKRNLMVKFPVCGMWSTPSSPLSPGPLCRPVGWGVRMHRLHLCRGVRLPQWGHLLAVGGDP